MPRLKHLVITINNQNEESIYIKNLPLLESLNNVKI